MSVPVLSGAAPVSLHHRVGRHRVRFQTDDRGRFDELVVVIGRSAKPGSRSRNGLVLHAEMMDDRSCFVDVAGVCLWVYVDVDGVARISCSEDRRLAPTRSLNDLRDPALDEAPRGRRRSR